MKTIYAKMTQASDGVVLELLGLGHHVMGATLAEATTKATDYLATQPVSGQAVLPRTAMLPSQKIITLTV